jgi:hypothetical protein
MYGETSKPCFDPVFSPLWSTIISSLPIVSEVIERKNEMCQHRRLFALAAVILLSACGPQAPPTPPPVVDGSSLLSSLEGAGVRLREVEVEITPIEGAVSRAYSVNGEEILLYEFPTEKKQDVYSQEFIEQPGEGAEFISPDAKLWGAGKLLVIYEGTDGGTILLFSGLLGDPLVALEAGIDEPFPPAVVAAIYLVADDVGVDPTMIEVSMMTPVIWPDSCLMVPDLDEGCLEVETPGWRVVLEIYGETIEVHTDEYGEDVRWR